MCLSPFFFSTGLVSRGAGLSQAAGALETLGVTQIFLPNVFVGNNRIITYGF